MQRHWALWLNYLPHCFTWHITTLLKVQSSSPVILFVSVFSMHNQWYTAYDLWDTMIFEDRLFYCSILSLRLSFQQQCMQMHRHVAPSNLLHYCYLTYIWFCIKNRGLWDGHCSKHLLVRKGRYPDWEPCSSILNLSLFLANALSQENEINK